MDHQPTQFALQDNTAASNRSWQQGYPIRMADAGTLGALLGSSTLQWHLNPRQRLSDLVNTERVSTAFWQQLDKCPMAGLARAPLDSNSDCVKGTLLAGAECAADFSNVHVKDSKACCILDAHTRLGTYGKGRGLLLSCLKCEQVAGQPSTTATVSGPVPLALLINGYRTWPYEGQQAQGICCTSHCLQTSHCLSCRSVQTSSMLTLQVSRHSGLQDSIRSL